MRLPVVFAAVSAVLASSEAQAARVIAVPPLAVRATAGMTEPADPGPIAATLRMLAEAELTSAGWIVVPDDSVSKAMRAVRGCGLPRSTARNYHYDCEYWIATETHADFIFSWSLQPAEGTFVLAFEFSVPWSDRVLASERVEGVDAAALKDAFRTRARAVFAAADVLAQHSPRRWTPVFRAGEGTFIDLEWPECRPGERYSCAWGYLDSPKVWDLSGDPADVPPRAAVADQEMPVAAVGLGAPAPTPAYGVPLLAFDPEPASAVLEAARDRRRSRGRTYPEGVEDVRREEAIRTLKRLLSREKSMELRGDLLFRLADLLTEKAALISARGASEARIGAGSEGPSASRLATSESDRYSTEAIDAYSQLSRDFPQHPRSDEARLALGRLLVEMARRQTDAAMRIRLGAQALAAWQSILRSHPDSPVVADALVQMGDYYFDHDDLMRADEAFSAALAHATADTATHALYKLGWCRINQGDYLDAIRKFQDVIARVDRAPTDEGRELRTVALRDLTLAYARTGGILTARDYFVSTLGQAEVRHYLALLAQDEFREGVEPHMDAAIHCYRDLLRRYPNDPETPEWRAQIAVAYRKLGKYDAVMPELDSLLADIQPGSGWWQANESPLGRRRARATAEATLYNLATWRTGPAL